MPTCTTCQRAFEDSEKEQVLRQKIEGILGVGPLPTPTLCQDCRLTRQMTWRNERTLYTRTCDKTGQNIISIYPANSPFPVYERSVWWSDDWNALDYGREIDFSRPFFDQLRELQHQVPRVALNSKNVENSDFCNFAFDSRNCYLAICCYYSESILYSYWMLECKDCTECSYCFQSQQCYECTDCNECYGCYECVQCNNCSESHFLFDCRGCKHCFGCIGLRNAEYHMFNQPVSREEYEKRLAEFDLQNSLYVESVQSQLAQLKLKHPHKFSVQEKCEDSTGDHMVELKDCRNCFQAFRSRDCLNVMDADGNQDLLDCYHAGWSEVGYEEYSPVRLKNSAFCAQCWDGNDMFYCDSCQNCSHCFGCVCLRQKEYCIFNKQYSKEEYEELLPKLVAHMQQTEEWGQYFPPALSPHSYNETIAHTDFPFNRETAAARGWQWQEQLPFTTGKETLALERVPQRIEDVSDTMCNEVLACNNCQRNYRIINQELEILRQKKLPLPRQCPDCRNASRLARRNPKQLHDRTCHKCNRAIQTTFSPDQPEIVYCETCYQEAVYN